MATRREIWMLLRFGIKNHESCSTSHISRHQRHDCSSSTGMVTCPWLSIVTAGVRSSPCFATGVLLHCTVSSPLPAKSANMMDRCKVAVARWSPATGTTIPISERIAKSPTAQSYVIHRVLIRKLAKFTVTTMVASNS